MKLFRFALNLWFTLASLLSFLLGWAALAHSPKPLPPVQRASAQAPVLPTLTPLQLAQPGNNGQSPQGFQFQGVNPNLSSQAPIFLSGGS